jgi:catechol 2,3-dioxygenase-like lactoylglutathione lyase family enzyme
MERITGIGGVFFRAQEPDRLRQWYEDHLGLPPGEGDDATVVIPWREREDPDRLGQTVWAPFDAETTYFGKRENQWMVNFRVRDLDAMLAQLRAAGAHVDDQVESFGGLGRFGWFEDPEGNRVELWEPADGL